MRIQQVLVLSGLIVFSSFANAGSDANQRKRLAASTNATAAQLQQYTKDPEWEVRQAVARNRRTPVNLLAILAQDPHPQVRISVATNLSTDEAIFMVLANDSDVQVRSVVARFEYVPASVLAVMASDPVTDIRIEVARNLNTDRATLTRLMKDSQPEVVSMANIGLQRGHTDQD
jgi:hypothetical protein